MTKLTGQKKLHHIWIGKMYSQLKKSAGINNQPKFNYSREEFTTWLYSQDKFQEILDRWDARGNTTRYTPKVNVIDTTKPFTLDNLELDLSTLDDFFPNTIPITSTTTMKTEVAVEAEFTEISDIAQYQAEAITQANLTIAGLKQTVISAAKTGAALAKVKEGMPRGEYLPWIKDNMPVAERQCQKYVKLAENRPELLLANTNSSAYLDINTELKLLSMDVDEANEMRDSITEHGFNSAESKEFISRVQANLDKENAVAAQKTASQKEYDKRHKQVIQADVADAIKEKNKALRDKTAVALQAERIAKRDANHASNRVKPLESMIADRDERLKEANDKKYELEKKLKSAGSNDTKALQSEIDVLNKKYADLEAEKNIESKEIDRLNDEIETQSNNSDVPLTLLVQAKALIQEAFNVGDLSDSAISIQTDIFEMTVPKN